MMALELHPKGRTGFEAVAVHQVHQHVPGVPRQQPCWRNNYIYYILYCYLDLFYTMNQEPQQFLFGGKACGTVMFSSHKSD